jgi:transglutaminase-like putative cysteine protease
MSRWRHLPRDTRDTWFLLAVIAWVSLPHWFEVPWWCALLSVAVILWRAALAWSGQPLPGRWVLVTVLMLAMGLTLHSHGQIAGREPGMTLAVALLSLKTLELRARRDAFVVFFLGFFLVLAQFLRSQSLLTAIGMLLSVWGLLTGLVLAHMPAGVPALRLAAGISARTALLGAPIMVALFIFFPRIGPLWGVPGEALGGTGLSNSLRMGSVAEIALDDSIAMRVRFDRTPPSPQSLYFRGPVLTAFDGEEWRPLSRSRFPQELQPSLELRHQGEVLNYEVTLEANRLRSVPLLEATTDITDTGGATLSLDPDLQWRSATPLMDRLRLRARAALDFQHGPTQPILGLQDHLELPPSYNPRTLAWAAQLRAQPRLRDASASELVRAVMQHIRQGNYRYSLAPGVYGEDSPRGSIDEFWLDRQVGFCEHYASAFVVIMRAMDIPARIVTGYQGTDPEPVDGYWAVRNSAAHAWAEYWEAGRGWLRADPTAAVAPERVERGQSLRPPPGIVGTVMAEIHPDLLLRTRQLWESVNNRWNQWVLNYSSSRQFDLLRKLGVQTPAWEDLARLLGGALALIALGGAAWSAWLHWSQTPWQREMARWRAATQSLAVPWQPSDTPRQMAARLRERWQGRQAADAAVQALCRTLLALEDWRYAGATSPAKAPAAGSSPAGPPPPRELTRQFLAQARALRRQLGRSALREARRRAPLP